MSYTRYVVGQIVPVVSFSVKYPNGNINNSCLHPLPWEDTNLSINIRQFECTEHHKVSWNYDPDDKKDYDGFIFKDEKGSTVHNQYPSAHYGQLDDSQDWVFDLIMKDDQDKIADILSFVDLFHFLSNLLHDLNQLEKNTKKSENIVTVNNFRDLKTAYHKKKEKHHVDTLRKLYDDVVAKYEEQFHKKICTKPSVMEFIDPEKSPVVVEGFWDVYSE